MIHLTERGIRDEYHMNYEASLAVQPWRKFARIINTIDPNGETTVRTAGLRGMEERIGMPNFAASIPTAPYKWYTRPWTNGFQITADEWKYQKVDVVTERIQQLAALAAAHPWMLLESQLATLLDDVGVAAVKDPFYPAIGFISASHIVNKPGSQLGTTSNYFTVAAVPGLQWAAATPTDAEWIATMFGLAGAIMQIKGDNDVLMNANVKEFVIALSGKLWPSFAVCMSKLVNAAGTNPLLNPTDGIKFSYVMLPSSTSTTQLLVVPVGRTPYAVQMLEKPDKTNMDILGPETEHGRKENYYPVWVKGRYAVAHIAWEGICGALLDIA
jgi:hypothetical protein